MEIKEFKEQYGISDATPQSPTLQVMSADGFSEAIREFINERFRGIAHVSLHYVGTSGIFCSPEYTAYMLKALLTAIRGRVFLEITLKEVEAHLEILIEAEGPLPLTDSEMRNIIRLARNAGMQIYPSEGSLRLTMSFTEAAARRVYAISTQDSRRIMLGKLHEIILIPEIFFAKGRK